MKNKVHQRPARCKQVLCVLVNRLETVDLLRELVYPQTGGDYEIGPLEVAVVKYRGLEVHVPLDATVFLRDEPPRPNPVLAERRRHQRVILKDVAAGIERRERKALAEPATATSREKFERKMKKTTGLAPTAHKKRSKKEALEILPRTGIYMKQGNLKRQFQ
jgi:hypothetical protein